MNVNLNQQDHKGYTALHKCALREVAESVEQLVEGEADVNVKNDEGQTPLDIGVKLKNKLISEVLRDGGGKLNIEEIYPPEWDDPLKLV